MYPVCHPISSPPERPDVLMGRSYPPPDLVARLFDTIKPKQLSRWYCTLYLLSLFNAVLDELEVIGESRFPTGVNLARVWHSHLLHDDGEGRDRIYYKILNSIDQLDEGHELWAQFVLKEMFKAYDKLVATIRSCTLEEYDEQDPIVILYFDKTYSLARAGKRPTPDSAQQWPTGSGGDIHPTPYAAMCSALAHLNGRPCFTLFILTSAPPYTSDPPQEIPPSGIPKA